MSARATIQPKSQALLVLAEGLRASCEKLRSSAALTRQQVDRTPDDVSDEHLGQTQALQQEVARRCRDLLRRRCASGELSPELRAEVERAVSESRRLLQDAGRTYGELAAKIATLREEVGQELASMERGRRALGHYRQGVRISTGPRSLAEDLHVSGLPV